MYVGTFRNCSSIENIRKVILHFYTSAEISDAKKSLISTGSDMLNGCEYLTDRRTSTQRSASDTEVDDIIHLFDVLDSCDDLKELQFAALSYDRLPKYGPEEINVCAVVDKQIHTDSKLVELCAKIDTLSADPGSLATISATISDSDINKISNSFGNQLQASTRTIQDQLTQLTAVCNQLSGLSQSSSSVGHQLKDRQLDRSRNIVVTGVAEDRNDKVWKSNVVAVLQAAACRDVQILGCVVQRYNIGL